MAEIRAGWKVVDRSAADTQDADRDVGIHLTRFESMDPVAAGLCKRIGDRPRWLGRRPDDVPSQIDVDVASQLNVDVPSQVDVDVPFPVDVDVPVDIGTRFSAARQKPQAPAASDGRADG